MLIGLVPVWKPDPRAVPLGSVDLQAQDTEEYIRQIAGIRLVLDINPSAPEGRAGL
jgi:hypothetical protein